MRALILKLAGTALFLLVVQGALAQVQTDGTMGPAASLSGNMVIPNTLGTQAGANLFHSFTIFNIRPGESALFTSTHAGLTGNVIGRVTGGSPSLIDGLLQCDIPGAGLWLINPNGIAFGQNASLDIQGSFRATTADYLLFADGGRFSADPAGSAAVLSTASPAAFGFLDANPAPIAVGGSELQLPRGSGLSLVGGGIDISGATIWARGGRIEIVSVASPGEVRIAPSSGRIDIGPFEATGGIAITGRSFVTASDLIDAGGSVYIRGGRFLVDASTILNATGFEDGGGIDIGVAGDAVVNNGSRIATGTQDEGNAGDVSIKAGGNLQVTSGAWITSFTSGFGNSGGVAAAARNIEVSDGGRIATSTDSFSLGDAGPVSVTAAETLSIAGAARDFTTGIASNSFQSFGRSGDLTVSAKRLAMSGGVINTENVFSVGASGDATIAVTALELSGGALISSSSGGSGSGGDLRITATDSVTLTENSSIQSAASRSGAAGSVSIVTPRLTIDRSSVSTATFGPADAGDIDIAVGRLDVTSGFITSDASILASGDAGNVSISATGEISMRNTGTALDRPGISSSSFGDGDAGSVTINAGSLTLDDAVVDSETLGGAGAAGTIKVKVARLSLKNGGGISSDVGQSASGEGGSIEVAASESIAIEGGSPTIPGFRSGISTGTLGEGSAGSISVTTPDLKIDGGTITASTAFGTGGAGNIFIEARNVSLTREGNIQVGTYGAGDGGSLQLTAGRVTIDASGPAAFKTGISSQAEGSGAGGAIRLAADHLELRSGGIISAKSSGTGRAGALSFDIRDTLTMSDSSILTNAELSAGGNIEMRVGDRLLLRQSTITSSANGVTATDNGGNLTMARPQFLVMNRGSILARANAGNGGNITLGAEFFVQSADSIINASSNRGLDGRIVIDSPHQVTGTINALEVPRLDISELLRERCAASAFEERSSFTVEGWSGVPARAGDYLSTPPMRPRPGAPNPPSGSGAAGRKHEMPR